MDEEKKEGIILKVVAYQDFHEIANLFGPAGPFSVIRKWGRSKKKAPMQPLTRVEVLYKPGRGDLHTALEISELDPYLKIRDRYDTLTAAMECLDAIKKTQLNDQNPDSSHPLYTLLKATLEKLPLSSTPQNLASAFYLKILLHEGMLPDDKITLPMTELLLTRSWTSLFKLDLPPEVHLETKNLFIECVS